MTTATAKTTAKKTRKPQPLNGDLLPNTEGPALRFIALDVIDAHAQVRTEFKDESIAELAEDLKARGMLQPVLLRPADEGRYIIIAGERRIRAARVAGLAAVPAIVGETTPEQADDMQLAENIQREELSLADTAKRIRKLYDREGKIDLVASIVKKSKSWVSKHLAVTCPDFDWKARKLLDEGKTDDLELLNTLSAIDKLDYQEAMTLYKKIEGGKAGRKEAREILARVKKEAEQRQAETKAAKKKAKKAPKQPETKSPFHARNALWSAVNRLQDTEKPLIAEILACFSEEQQNAMLDTLQEEHQRGELAAHMEPIEKMRRLTNALAHAGMDDLDNAAYIIGAFNIEWTLPNLMAEMERAFNS
jgi:ParB/RepB/Spo0J family partition protein